MALKGQGTFSREDPTLTALAGVSSAANKIPYFTGEDTAAVADLPSGYNYIINPCFEINQRGVANQTTNGTYPVDMWKTSFGGTTAACTYSQQAFTVGQTDVPGEPINYIRCVTTAGTVDGSSIVLKEHIESVKTLAGQTCTLSFWAKADTAKPIAVNFYQNFGSGGSTTVATPGQKVTLSTSWAKYTLTFTLPSISGKTIGTSHYMYPVIWLEAGATYNTETNTLGHQAGTFEFANVKLEAGSVATPFRVPTYAEELQKCQRYFVRFSSALGAYTNFGIGYTVTTSRFLAYKDFPVQMRAAPTITTSAASTFAAGIQLTSITFTTVTPFNFCSDCGATWSAAALPYLLYANNTTSAYMDCSAEL